MVSSVASTQLLMSQIYMRVSRETAAQNTAATDTSPADYFNASLGNLMRTYGDAAEGGDDTYDQSWLRSRAAQDAEAVQEEISDDIRTASFMTGLKDRLQEMTRTGDAVKAKEMLSALEDGTLEVTDAPSGRQVTAFLPDEESADRDGGSVTASDWSSFLKNNLSRERTGGYQLTDSGAHVDRTTGKSASFITVGGIYVYLTWPAPGAGG
ncbi:hypothetical protein GVN24_03820 [Rhizobium sp. CRIBSB]|nr:hypothetical protein [Rhizobium sp. CRIBSB]